MERMEEKVAAHEATLAQMNQRLGSIETRLTSIEARLDGKASNWLVGAGIAWLSFWMGFLSWLSR
jgi:hypothetical protein